MKLLRVNMTHLKAELEELPAKWQIVGGRGLSVRILNTEMPSEADPLGEQARFIIAGGPLAGTLAPSCGRISIGGKSPLTLGVKEANAGGTAAQKLDRLGIRAIVVEGAPRENKLYVLHISKDKISIENGDQYAGLKNYSLVQELYKNYGKKPSIISIGMAGERKWKSATVAITDQEGHPSRHAARGGLGAVMGAKGLKAIVIDDDGADGVELANKETFRAALRSWPEVLKADTRLASMSKYGTTAGIAAMRSIGTAPSKNYSSEQTEGYENLAGPAFEETNKARGGHMTGCMPGCIIRCSMVYHDAEGKYLTAAYEYETIALLGTNLGIADSDSVALFDRICDELGIDTIEIGSAMGVAASAGKMEFGNAKSALALFDEIEKETEFGAILANGVVSTAKALGITRIPAFKGQAIPAHDPRVTKATGVTYHTSPMGADHTAGVSYEDFKNKEGQVERSLKTQIFIATIDSLAYCLLAMPEDRVKLLTFLKDLINARYGLNQNIDDLINIGRETLKEELKFNRGTEFSTAHDPDPEFIRTEPLAPIGNVFDVDPDEIAAIWDQLDTIPVLEA